MSHAVIPAPVRFDVGDGREFAFRSGTTVTYSAPGVATIIERFCSEITRRTGLRLGSMAGHPVLGEPSVTIELAAGGQLGALPASIGVSPTGDGPPDERHSLVVDADQVVLRAAEPAGVARGLTTLLQLVAATSDSRARAVSVPGARIVDAPRYAWRGLLLDVARRFLTVDEIRRVIDLLALYKLNVLHLHLTDDQGWRLPMGRRDDDPAPDAEFYTADDLRSLVAYAEDRFVTLVPEVDSPGHSIALVRMHPELSSGRNEIEFELPPGHKHQAAWLDPELPATFQLMEELLTGVAEIFPTPYIHIGGDEPYGMPHDLYAAYVQRLRDLVRSLGKRPLGFQESARAGLGPDDLIQYWYTDITLAPGLPPEVEAQQKADVALSRRDVEIAMQASSPVIVSPLSHVYLDVPYADPPADAAQADRQSRLGLRIYARRTVADSFAWEPADVLGPGRGAHVGGVEAAIWAESITDLDDLTFLLLPRLPGVAQKAWSDPAAAGSWRDHRDRLARHGRLWAQDNLTYFRTSTVDWV